MSNKRRRQLAEDARRVGCLVRSTDLAQHPRLPRRDALKLLARDVSADPSFRERLLREADLASTLWHPHVVGVHDRGEYQGQLWIAMDFVDGRADQYSLAATGYHLLTGTPLFPRSNPAVVISHHLNTAPPALAGTRPELSALDPVLAAALAKNPDDRFPRCSDFARALAEQTHSAGAPTPAASTTPAPVSRSAASTSEPRQPPCRNQPRRRAVTAAGCRWSPPRPTTPAAPRCVSTGR